MTKSHANPVLPRLPFSEFPCSCFSRCTTASVTALLIALSSCITALAADTDSIDFEKQIRPLLLKHCADCHGPDQQSSSLRLDAKHGAMKGGDGGPVIVPGKSNESELLRRITSDDPDDRMPPESAPLPDTVANLIRRWIDAGAEWPETEYDRQAAQDPRLKHWSFQPLADVELPDAVSPDGTPIDRFIIAELNEHGLHPAPTADRRTLIRRLYFDVLGLPPTPEEVDAFAKDQAPDAWPRLIDRVLSSPRYGERWAQHWLDIVRYADTHGFEVNTPRENAWPYRDYVVRAFNADKPYDQFVREQLAGDALQADEATGFLVAAAVLLPGQIGKDEASQRLARQDALDEIINGTSATLLGLTLGCARCHDHKFDPVSQRDYYAMQAFFAGVEYGDRPMKNASFLEQLDQAKLLGAEIAELQQQLHQYEPIAFTGRTLLIDDEDEHRVTILKQKNGHGANPPGTDRGYKDDTGSADRAPNLSRGRYTWWDNVPGEDVMTYNPGVHGEFRLWLSWGVHGSGVHTRDAVYLLDPDGDLATRDDQTELARADQYYPAGVTSGETEKKPLWSGLLDVGRVQLTESSKIVVRGGNSGTGITADVIVLQDVDKSTGELPRLRAPIDPRKNVERVASTTAKFVRFTTLETIDSNRHEPCIDELEIYAADASAKNIALAEHGATATSSGNYSETGRHQLKHVNDGRYGNERSWISNEYGGGWVQIELAEPTALERIVWGRDRNGNFTDRLPVRYRIETSTDGKKWQLVASHTDRVPHGTPHDPIKARLRTQPQTPGVDLSAIAARIESLQSRKKQLETPPMVYGGTFREPGTTHVLRRGDPEQPVEAIDPAVPALFDVEFSTTLTSDQQRRLALAEWVASPENPLTARVMVNRIWQYHFGRGLVETASDFGINGARPSHPGLLDWLAAEFVRSGWSIKHLHRLILTSTTYRQSSRIEPHLVKIDRDNQLLWRFPSRRLEAEAIRDTMLSVSGELNLQMGGPGFNFFKSRGGLSGFPPVEEFTPAELRRMIYAHKVRMESVPVFGAFDCPDAGQAMPRRSQSTTAIQALNLFNSRFVAVRAERFAARVQAESPASVTDQIQRAFALALGRQPTSAELDFATRAVNGHGLDTLCRALFNSNEFLFLP